ACRSCVAGLASGCSPRPATKRTEVESFKLLTRDEPLARSVHYGSVGGRRAFRSKPKESGMQKTKVVATVVVLSAWGTLAFGLTHRSHSKPAQPVSCKGGSKAVPMGRTGASSTVVLAKTDGRRVAYIADEDKKAILTVDLDTHREI